MTRDRDIETGMTLMHPDVEWVPLLAEGPSLRGTEARTFSAERIDIIDLNITTFNGDATAKVDSILLCRELASFFPNEKIVRGESTVRLMRDDLEITGEQWTYDHAAKKVSLARHARITFKAQLPDILK